MIATLIASGLLGICGLVLRAMFYFAPARHAGSGEGALTVAYLVARADAETRDRGRHRLREPVVLRGDLASSLAEARANEVTAETTRQLPVIESGLPVNDPEMMQRHPGVLRRLLAALRGLAS